MPKVVFVNRFYWPDTSATSQILTDLAEFLVARDWEVEIWTSRLLYAGGGRLSEKETQKGVNIRRLWTTHFGRGSTPGRAMDYLTFYGSLFFRMLLGKRNETVLIVKTDPPMLSILGAVVGAFRRQKLVSWCQDVFPEVAVADAEGGIAVKVFRGLIPLRNWSLRRCEGVVVLGQAMRDYLVQSGIPESGMATLPNWAIQGNENPEERDFRKEWGLEGKIVIAYCGNLGRAHDWKTFFEGIRKAELDDCLRFLIVGGGKGKEELQDAVDSVGLGDRFLFKNYVSKEHLPDLLRTPDLHWVSLKPSMEGLVFPSKIVGILAAGRPILYTGDPSGEIGQWIQRHKMGFECGLNQPDAVGEVLEKIQTDPHLLESMARNASKAYEEFSRDTAVQNWANWLSQNFA